MVSWRDLRQAVQTAMDNIDVFGDTDIFHEPVELPHARASPKRMLRAIRDLHATDDLKAAANHQHPTLRSLVPAGAHGFRLGTLIDPVWNTYYLALALKVARPLERVRPSLDRQVVYSYRMMLVPQGGRIFDPAVGWRQFMDRTQQLCGEYQFVVQGDVAEFYHRITFSSLEQALGHARVSPWITERLLQLLAALEIDRYGLPIGGPASRILAEAVLAEVDARLIHLGIIHCRFVDDYRLFARTQAEADRGVYTLAEVLWEVGLSLQKSKTRVLRVGEQLEEIRLARLAMSLPTGGGPHAPWGADLVVDPYSELRAQGDGALEALALHADAVAIIRREFAKTRANPSLGRRLLASFRQMPPAIVQQAVFALTELRSLNALFPVFLRFIGTMEAVRKQLGSAGRAHLVRTLKKWMMDSIPIMRVPAHEAAALALLARLPGRPELAFSDHLIRRHVSAASILVKREIVLYWAAKGSKKEFSRAYRHVSNLTLLDPWELRAVKVAQETLEKPNRRRVR